MKDVIVLGAGGHAKVVISTLLSAGFKISGIYDDDSTKVGSSFFGYRVLGKIRDLKSNPESLAILAIGNNSIRKELASKFSFKWISAVHPNAFVDSTALVEEGSVVFAGAVIQASAKVGRHCIVNTGAQIDHDSIVGDFVHLGPRSALGGEVSVGEGAFLGMGSIAIPQSRIGAWATIGAGAVVLKEIPEKKTAVGVPAKVKV
jgi:sugar O-acyltransferase (sialic acid O-acetyltransferase NeuD family)